MFPPVAPAVTWFVVLGQLFEARPEVGSRAYDLIIHTQGSVYKQVSLGAPGGGNLPTGKLS
jgi:hypothetical protein